MEKEIENLLTRGVENIIVKEDLEKKLMSGKKLRIKLGIDPTGSRLHIGRAVPLRKLRAFQEKGHQIVLIIGDFTGIVGDASDKDSERPMLTREKVTENMKDYLPQLGRVIDIDQCEIHYNSQWLSKLDFYEISKLAQNFSVAEMLDRDNFSKRYKSGKRISLHEFLYPLMQGYDSVAVKSDVEVGGTDQLFNVLAGRTLQKAFDQAPQNIMTFKLLEGTDGRKMSTSWGNTIYLDDAPKEMFGKVMSLPDNLMMKYFELCTDEDLEEMKKFTEKDPRNAKVHLAKSIITFYHNDSLAQEAEKDFVTKFVKKDVPEDIPVFEITEKSIPILTLLTQVCGFASSNSQARRLIEQGAVSLDGEKCTDPQAEIPLQGEMILKAGKRNWGRIEKK